MPIIQRSPRLKPTTVCLEADAKLLLLKYTPTAKSYGSFISRLLFEHDVRMEARAQADADYAALQRVYRLPAKVEVAKKS